MKRLNRIYTSLVVLSFLMFFPTYAFPELFPIPHIENDVLFVYLQTPVKQESFINKKWGLDYLYAYSTEQHKRVQGPDGEKVIMIGESIDRDVGSFIVTIEFKEKDGRLQQIRSLKEIIKFSGEKVLVHDVDFEGLGKTIPEDSYTGEIMTFLFKGLNMTPKSKFSYHWWASDRSVFPMHLKVKKPKEITTSSGTHRCYPIELSPMNIAEFLNKGDYLNTIITPFLPDTIMYFDANPPHHFVYYKGSFGPPGSPEVVLELVKIVKGEEEIAKIKKRMRSPELYVGKMTLPNIFD